MGKRECESVKTVSVLLTLGLLAAADQLSIRLKRAGALPENHEPRQTASPAPLRTPPGFVLVQTS